MREERRKQEEKQEELTKKVKILQEESRLNHSDGLYFSRSSEVVVHE